MFYSVTASFKIYAKGNHIARYTFYVEDSSISEAMISADAAIKTTFPMLETENVEIREQKPYFDDKN